MKKVLLTGVSGYIGMQCAVELLKNGYAVKGSLRSLSKSDKVLDSIKKIVDPKDNLEFCELNLLKDEGWDDAMLDCDYVLHVASPFVTSEPKDENDLIKPAVEGTLRALKAAKRTNIKRVVLTSSMVAMLGDANGTVEVNQSSWTNVNNKKMSAYVKSKTLAEKSAWEFINQQEGNSKLEMVTIHPGPVYGPTISGNLTGESMSTFEKLITGKMPLVPNGSINMSDVRDVAKIHVQAIENKEANGQRFIVATEKAHSFLNLAEILKSNGYEKVSTKVAPNFLLRLMAKFNPDLKGMLPFIGNTYNGDVSATEKTFSWKPIELENTVLETAKSVEEAMA